MVPLTLLPWTNSPQSEVTESMGVSSFIALFTFTRQLSGQMEPVYGPGQGWVFISFLRSASKLGFININRELLQKFEGTLCFIKKDIKAFL